MDGDKKILIFCRTPKCFRKEVALAEVASYVTGCPNCNLSLQFGKEKTPTDIAPLNELEELEPEWFLSFSPEEDITNIGTLASRCTSFVVTARTIQQIAQATDDERVIVHSDAIERTEENLRSYRKMIEEAERRLSRISGGDRLSSGFPKDEDSARRHSRELLGGDSRSGRITEEGLLSKLGIIKVERDDSAQIRFTKEVGEKLLAIEMPNEESVNTITVSKRQRFSDVLVPEYYSKEDSENLAKLITKNAEGEKKLMHRVLKRLNNSGHNPPNMGELAQAEINQCEKGKEESLRYWFPLRVTPKNRDGGMTVNRKSPDEMLPEEGSVLQKKVLSGMNVAVGRMRELRLIFGVREGWHVRFFINDVKEAGEIGKRLLMQWDREELESDV